MNNLNTATIIGWSLIFILFLIVNKITLWSRNVQKKAFDNAVQDAVKKELHKKETKTQESQPGSEEHYQKWKAEREMKSKEL